MKLLQLLHSVNNALRIIPAGRSVCALTRLGSCYTDRVGFGESGAHGALHTYVFLRMTDTQAAERVNP